MTRKKADEYADERAEVEHYYATHPKAEHAYQYSHPIGPNQSDRHSGVNSNQYPAGAGPRHPHSEMNRNQYRQAIGPEQSRVDPNQYPNGAGPQHTQQGNNPNQYAQPIGPQPQSSYEKIASAARRGAGAARGAAGAVNAVGAAAAQHVSQGPTGITRSMAGQSGFHQYSGQAAPRSPTSRADYAGAPVDPNSTMHPGNHLYVIQGTMVSSKNIGPKKPREPRSKPWQRGGLGGNDPGF